MDIGGITFNGRAFVSKASKVIAGCVVACIAWAIYNSFEIRSAPHHHMTPVTVDGHTYYHDDDLVTVRDEHGEEHTVNREDLNR